MMLFVAKRAGLIQRSGYLVVVESDGAPSGVIYIRVCSSEIYADKAPA